jgi:uncharacterized short protein YbdD (DUF466 family)
MEMMADAMLKEEYEKYVYDLLEIRPEATPMSFEEFRQMTLAEGQMSKGPILPSPEDPVNPFQPKPQDQFYLTDRWQRMVVSWVWMVDVNMVLEVH